MTTRLRAARLVQVSGILAFALIAQSCSHAPAPARARAPEAPQAVVQVKRPPPPTPDLGILSDQPAIAAAQRALNQIGYDAGKPDGVAGPATRRAILAFEKDHGLTEDGRLTAALADNLKTVSEVAALTVAAGDTLVYSDGAVEVVAAERDVQWEQRDGARSLVAIRPSTANWPPAARAGLDWATTYALELPAASPPVQWSSTGVGEHFEIRTAAVLSEHDAALAGGQNCRRFELRSDDHQRRYPAIACKDAKGAWYIAHSHIRLARPATGLGPQTASGSTAHGTN
ncbi:MAG TPA: peptidoglycan-binding protein [Rhizomicrobium sp.]|jgi:peptidoglycan hydrolase-like protein with peptidoglycan-binding domain|nr:peptidoglycan-binding protein [Rhizomicrobium sp.]